MSPLIFDIAKLKLKKKSYECVEQLFLYLKVLRTCMDFYIDCIHIMFIRSNADFFLQGQLYFNSEHLFVILCLSIKCNSYYQKPSNLPPVATEVRQNLSR